jgi:hypothetical protein
VFAPLKAAYRDQVEQLERGGVNTIGKGHFKYLYRPTREIAFTKKNILAGWSKSGLFPFNPDGVLRDTPTRIATLNVPGAGEVEMASCPEGYLAQTPLTPATPVTSEGLVSLQDLINKDAHTLDEVSKSRLR